jgi:lipopolysaccharide/colanic/teichoic acid biosynthesis glycosyltransferase
MNRFGEQTPGRLLSEIHLSALQEEMEIASMRFRDSWAPAALELHADWKPLSPWSRSALKRFFDCACVLVALPVLVPLILAIGAAVRVTSSGPVMFRQKRVGRNGQPFTILKFRTMIHVTDRAHRPVTTSDNQQFTPVGPFLRRWKLDELPQLANVLLGHMSLVGPRPKLPEHVILDPPCRPGVTGMATIVFACEEATLARVPKDHLDAYYYAVVLPAKRQLDIEYMARATFLSDLKLLVNSVLHRWDDTALESSLLAAALEYENGMTPSRVSDPPRISGRKPLPISANQQAEVEQASAS